MRGRGLCTQGPPVAGPEHAALPRVSVCRLQLSVYRRPGTRTKPGRFYDVIILSLSDVSTIMYEQSA